MKTNCEMRDRYLAPTFETNIVATEKGFCASDNAFLNGFNDPTTADFDFDN